jgi:hypothetical protein
MQVESNQLAEVAREWLLSEIRAEIFEDWLSVRGRVNQNGTINWIEEITKKSSLFSFDWTESAVDALFRVDDCCFPDVESFVSSMGKRLDPIIDQEETKKEETRNEADDEDPETDFQVDRKQLKRRLQQDVHQKLFCISDALQTTYQTKLGGSSSKTAEKKISGKTSGKSSIAADVEVILSRDEVHAILSKFLPKVVATQEGKIRLFMWESLYSHLAPEPEAVDENDQKRAMNGKEKEKEKEKEQKEGEREDGKVGEIGNGVRVTELLVLVRAIPAPIVKLPTSDELLAMATRHVFAFWREVQQKLKLGENPRETSVVAVPAVIKVLMGDFGLGPQQATDVCCLLDPYDKVSGAHTPKAQRGGGGQHTKYRTPKAQGGVVCAAQ